MVQFKNGHIEHNRATSAWVENNKDDPEIQQIVTLMALLKEHGIELNIYACDCCENPEIQVWHLGKRIVKTKHLNFTMRMSEDN